MKLFLGGSLAFHTPTKQSILEVQLIGKTKLTEIVHILGIPIAEVQLTVLNGELVDLKDISISDGDEVRLYPLVDGG